ncbi:MAG: N-acetyltransferase family protein [Rickettsiales bacterium]
MMSPLIRSILPQEFAQVRELSLEARKELPNFFGTTYNEEMERSAAVVQAQLAKGHVYGAWQNRELIACAGYFSGQLSKLRHKANLYGLYTHPHMRQRGMMIALLQRMIHEMPTEITVLGASVVSDNLAAQNILKKLGFSAYATEEYAMRDELGAYHDLVLMRMNR